MVLIQFKSSLVDNANRLSSWYGDDCCSWSGVVCDNFTHHVHELHLRGPVNEINGHCHGPYDTDDEFEEATNQMLGGIVSPSLIELKELRYLDLSCNDFGLSPIPAFIGSLLKLRYLNISKSQFAGEIPHQLGNLSTLFVLDVHDDPSSGNLHSINLKWIENMDRLHYLNMGGINLTGASEWLHASCDQQSTFFARAASFFILRKLITLDLTACFIGGLNLGGEGGFDNMPSLETLRLSDNVFVNTSSLLNGLSSSSNLRYLDVSSCDLYNPILRKLQNLSRIVHLDVSNNHIDEEIPKSLSNLCNMSNLDLLSNHFFGDASDLLDKFCECESPQLELIGLRRNYLTGRLPEKLGRLKNLANIDIAYNMLTGILPHSLGNLSALEFLDLSYNRLNGTIPESLGKLGKLSFLKLDHNSLTGILTEIHFSNLTALNTLSIWDNNELVFDLVNNWIPPFQLNGLLISSCSIGPVFPSWIQSQTNLFQLDLANTNISDTIPNWFWSTFSSVMYLNISNNNIMGKLGDVSTFIIPGAVLDLSFNQFHGEVLPRNFNKPDMEFLDLSSNNLSGSLDHFLCSGIQEPRPLSVLNLANNNMSGGLPDCWMNWEALVILNLEKNKFSGKIPPSLGNISSLESIDIGNNKLSGEMSPSLLNSKSLLIVELAENELNGRIPPSIGRNVTSLKILSLRSNKLYGEIPNEICLLSSIQILDLGSNNLSGYLPKCITNFTVFSGKKTSSPIMLYGIFQKEVLASATLVTKGHLYSYSNILYLVTTLDLSNNNFPGWIPNELMSLPGLRYLNLSHNKLTGRIPNTFSEMGELESLDLSMNHLDGKIPLSLAMLTGLSLLNVSYNNLKGTIPIGCQLQTLNETSFIGNALCGAPLPGCRRNSDDANNEDHDEPDGIDWILVICMIVGLVVGFWITIGIMIVSQRWRYAYFRFLDEMKTRLSNFILLIHIHVSSIFC
ncbi:hypothetical protein LXL04_008334 [Taraxacum kok-saghyz]